VFALAAEGQNLLHEVLGPAGGLEDFRDAFLRRRIVGQVFLQQITVAEHGGEDVVEIMRDAAGERADGLHFLRLPKLVFEGAAFGDVLFDGHEMRDLAVRAPHRRDGHVLV